MGKALRVHFTSGTQLTFEDSDESTYDYEVGQHNGCLVILRKRHTANPGGLIAIESAMEPIKFYAAHTWAEFVVLDD